MGINNFGSETAQKDSSEIKTTGLRPVLGYRDLVLFYLVAIFGIRLVPNAASAGPSVVILIIIVLIVYFVPLALTVSDLSMRYPEEGGIYVWTKRAFGDFHGYIAAWTYWTASLAFFPSLLLFSSSQIGLIVPGFEFLSESSTFLTIFSIATILFILMINIRGLKESSLINNVSAVARFVSVAFIILISVISFIQFGSATDLSFGNWIPNLSSIKDLVFLSTIVYLFAGLEGASMLGEEIHDAKKNIPRAILTSGFLITCLYILAALSLLVALSPSELSNLQGFTDAIRTSAQRIGGELFADISTSLMSMLLLILALGSTSVWLAATARLPFVVGLDRYLPPIFGKLHKKHNTPYISLIALVLVTIFFIILSGLGEKAEQVYKILISLEIVIFLIPNLYMFASVVKLEINKGSRDTAKLPGGRLNALVAGSVGFIVTGIALILALIPGENVENPLGFYITVFSSLAFNLFVGIGLYLFAKKKRVK